MCASRRLDAPRYTAQPKIVIATVGVFVLLYAAAAVYFDNFLSRQVLENMLANKATLGLAAIGMTFVILSGGIDLSVGSLISLVSISVAVLVSQAEMSPYVVIPLVLLGGTLFGLGQGSVIALFALVRVAQDAAWLIVPDADADALSASLQRFVLRRQLQVSVRNDLHAAFHTPSSNFTSLTFV